MVSTASGRNKVKRAESRRAGVGARARFSPAAMRAAALVLVVLASGCHPDPSTPRGTAEAFLDAHYVRIDLPAARELAAGVARHKVEGEIELVRGQVIDETTRKPTIHYRLLEEHPQGEDAFTYLYRADISVEDAEGFERRWLVTVRRQDGAWRVTNYQELEG
jgi:hypothetical protein